MATEPQTNPSETDPLLEKYEKFKNKAQAFETAIETKRDQLDIIRKKSGDPFAQDKKRAFSTLNEFGDNTGTIQNDFKKQLQSFKKTQLDQLTEIFLITKKNKPLNTKTKSGKTKSVLRKTGEVAGRRTIDTLVDSYNDAILSTKAQIPRIWKEELAKMLGCSEEQTYDNDVDIYIKLESIDFFGILKESPDSLPGGLFYETGTTYNGKVPYNMNKELYHRTLFPGYSFIQEYGQDYLGASSNQLFNIEYVTQDQYGNPGNFYKVQMKSRINDVNKVTDFLVDYYESIEILDFDTLIAQVLDMLTGAFSFSASVSTDKLREQKWFEKILQRILGLCFDTQQEIDVSGVAKLSVLDNIDDSFFELSPREYAEIDDEIINIQMGVTEFTSCDSVKLPLDVNSMYEYSNKAREASTLTDKLASLSESLDEMGENQNWNLLLPDVEFSAAIKTDFLKMIPKAILSAILSPKVVLGVILLAKAIKNPIVDEIENLTDFVTKLRDLIISVMSRIGAIFVETVFLNIKKNMNTLIQELLIDIIRESKDARIKMITSLIATAIIVQRGVRDFRRCKSVIDELLGLFRIIQANLGNPDLPQIALAAAKRLDGMNKTRTFTKIVEDLQQKGMPTGALPDGSPNMMNQDKKSFLEGFFDEMYENGKTEIFIPPLTITPAGLTLPSKGYGKSY